MVDKCLAIKHSKVALLIPTSNTKQLPLNSLLKQNRKKREREKRREKEEEEVDGKGKEGRT